LIKQNEQLSIKQNNIKELKELNEEKLLFEDKLNKIKKENVER